MVTIETLEALRDKKIEEARDKINYLELKKFSIPSGFVGVGKSHTERSNTEKISDTIENIALMEKIKFSLSNDGSSYIALVPEGTKQLEIFLIQKFMREAYNRDQQEPNDAIRDVVIL